VFWFWEVSFSPQPYSQPLFLTLPLFAESSAPCPTSVLQGWFSVPPHPLLSVVVYKFTVYVRGDSICPQAVLDFIPRIWVGKSCVIHGAHLLGLQIYSGKWGCTGVLTNFLQSVKYIIFEFTPSTTLLHSPFPDFWNSLEQVSFCTYLHVCTLFALPPPPHATPLTHDTQSGRTCSTLLLFNFVEEK
jgi:hypothetical protein